MGAGMVLVSSAMVGLGYIIIKVLSRADSGLTTTFIGALVATPVALAAALPVWTTPSLLHLLPLIGIATTATLGNLCLAQSLKEADITVVAPFEFLKLPWGALIGYAYFAAAPDYGATLIAARFPRGYVDPNRSHLDIDPAAFDDWQGPAEPTEKSRVGKGLIWTNLHGVEPLYARRLTGDEVRARIDNYWRPYHDAIAAAYERIHGEFGSVYHVNCHSMRAVGNEFDPDGETVRPDFVISNHDGKTCSPAFLDLIVEYLRTANFDVAINDPYKGAELTCRYADPAAKRHSLQIEINRRLYMDEMTIEKSLDFITFHNLMTGLVQAVCGFAIVRP